MSVNLLSQYGDPIEKKGINECGLGQSFPRYAEFWGKYVHPYRDSNDPSKLRPDYPEQLQDICNNHYYVFFHLTHAYLQLRYLKDTPLDQSIIDIGNPLYHLASSIDLTKKTFTCAFRVSGKRIAKKEDFGCAAKPIREYRNTLIHGLSPLRKLIEGKIYLPKPDSLSKYKRGRWSSPIDSTSDYEPAIEMICGLAERLVEACNNLWEILLAEMEQAKIKELYDKMAEVSPPQGNTNIFPNVENSPSQPSGYIPIKGGSGQDI